MTEDKQVDAILYFAGVSLFGKARIAEQDPALTSKKRTHKQAYDCVLFCYCPGNYLRMPSFWISAL